MVSQRRSSPCGLFSRAEDKVKPSDDVIEELLRDPRHFDKIFLTSFYYVEQRNKAALPAEKVLKP